MKITCKKNNSICQADKMIYGHFPEHFHTQVYGGVYDPSSKFPNCRSVNDCFTVKG